MKTIHTFKIQRVRKGVYQVRQDGTPIMETIEDSTEEMCIRWLITHLKQYFNIK